ncbi:MAG: hypothetical protein RLZZ360_77 [Candidatus Parcubacteria bacterium]
MMGYRLRKNVSMIERQQVETILKANGIPATAPDEEIRSILISARWDNNDVDTALMVLKENKTNKHTHVDSLHRVFHSDERLTPADISSLLGVKVSLTNDDVEKIEVKRKKVERAQTIVSLTLALSIVLLGLTYLMYVEQAGVFHDISKQTNRTQ